MSTGPPRAAHNFPSHRLFTISRVANGERSDEGQLYVLKVSPLRFKRRFDLANEVLMAYKE
jgi:hypothetical protein